MFIYYYECKCMHCKYVVSYARNNVIVLRGAYTFLHISRNDSNMMVHSLCRRLDGVQTLEEFLYIKTDNFERCAGTAAAVSGHRYMCIIYNKNGGRHTIGI